MGLPNNHMYSLPKVMLYYRANKYNNNSYIEFILRLNVVIIYL